MFGQKQDANSTFEQPATIAPTEQSTTEAQSATTVQLNSSPVSLPDSPSTIVPTATAISTSQQAKIGEAQQPNRLYELMLVFLQFTLFVIIIVAFVPTLLWQQTLLQIIGSCMIAAGIALGVWAIVSFRQRVRILPSPDSADFLVTGGPFAYIRHPMYSALLLACAGLFMAYPTIVRFVAIIVLMMVLFAKMRYEERLLAERYNGYDVYKTHTGRLWPKIQRPKHERTTSAHSDVM